MTLERGTLTRCAVPYCRGYTHLRRRVFFGSYLCHRHQCCVSDATWARAETAETFGEQRQAWSRCVAEAVDRAL